MNRKRNEDSRHKEPLLTASHSSRARAARDDRSQGLWDTRYRGVHLRNDALYLSRHDGDRRITTTRRDLFHRKDGNRAEDLLSRRTSPSRFNEISQQLLRIEDRKRQVPHSEEKSSPRQSFSRDHSAGKSHHYHGDYTEANRHNSISRADHRDSFHSEGTSSGWLKNLARLDIVAKTCHHHQRLF